MLIVLAITTIVAGMAFTILTLFGRNIGLIQNNYAQSTQINLLEQQLTVDFNKFHEIKYHSETETLVFKTPLDSVIYTFSEESILRAKDTVSVNAFSKSFFYNGSEVDTGWVDALKIELKEGEGQPFLFIYKETDALHYMRENGN